MKKRKSEAKTPEESQSSSSSSQNQSVYPWPAQPKGLPTAHQPWSPSTTQAVPKEQPKAPTPVINQRRKP